MLVSLYEECPFYLIHYDFGKNHNDEVILGYETNIFIHVFIHAYIYSIQFIFIYNGNIK